MTLENPYHSPHFDSDAATTPRVIGRYLTLLAGFSRILSRASAVGCFVVTSCGFVFYPRPWCSHWSLQKRITFEIIVLGGYMAFASLLACIYACCLTRWSEPLANRPLWPAFALNAASLLMVMLTPIA